MDLHLPSPDSSDTGSSCSLPDSPTALILAIRCLPWWTSYLKEELSNLMLTGSIVHHLSVAPLHLHYAAVCTVDCSPHLNVRPRLWYFLPLLLNGWNDTDHRLSTVCASEAGHCYCYEAFRSLHISSSLGALTPPPWTCQSSVDFEVHCWHAFISQLEDLYLGAGATVCSVFHGALLPVGL